MSRAQQCSSLLVSHVGRCGSRARCCTGNTQKLKRLRFLDEGGGAMVRLDVSFEFVNVTE